MTTSELASAVLAAQGVQDASKEDAQTIALGIQHGPKNHEGKAWSGLAREARQGGK
jgi:hypothetical protein